MNAKRILMVDREKVLIELLARSLPADSIQVLAAGSSGEARSIIAKMPIDLLLIDFALTGATELMQEARKSNQGLIVIAMTEAADLGTAAPGEGVPVFCKSDGIADLLRLLELKLDIPLSAAGARKILVADDQQSVSGFIRECLIGGGYFVYTAANGAEALHVLEADPDISVVLLDIMMPEKGGIDTLVEIHSKNKDHPLVIMMTAVNDRTVAQAARQAGAFDYVTKPLDAEKILSAVNVAVAHLEYTHH